jgi:hypothetical protein
MPKIQCQCGAPFSAIQKVPDDGHLHLQCFCEKCARYFVVCMGSIPTPETCDELLSIFNAAPITVELVESDCKKN